MSNNDNTNNNSNNNNTSSNESKPDYQEFKQQVEQKNQQPSQGKLVGKDAQGNPVYEMSYQYDQQGNRLPPQTDSLGNPNKSRGVIGVDPNYQQGQYAINQGISNLDRPKWDKVNPPTVFQADQQQTNNNGQPQVQKIQNPTSQEELQQLIKQQETQTKLNQEASEERDKMLRLQIQGEYYDPPAHLKDHPYLATRKLRPVEQQAGQGQQTEQGEEVISITDQVQGQQQQQDQSQPIQPSQVKNGTGIDNLIPAQENQETEQTG